MKFSSKNHNLKERAAILFNCKGITIHCMSETQDTTMFTWVNLYGGVINSGREGTFSEL